ncbi:MAG: transglycosylase domain-containing protein, partial [Verrucomicrobiae bacterium]|nr:transglycosylase domain-containing protein [Verrucomicrobiae bacterium]
RISCPPAKRNIATKIRETLGARRLEMTWTKDEILAAYLNRLDYGNRRTGIAEAARFYFQKPLDDLSLAECALLAGLPQGPSWLNPLKHRDRALSRRNVVLRRMAKNGTAGLQRVATALTEPLLLRPLRIRRPAPWLASFHPPASAPGEAVRTTLDLALQRDIETVVREETAKLRAANLRHAAVVILDNRTAEILALVSSADWSDPRGGQINGALLPRSPGSTLKPFTYLLAIEHDERTPCSILADVPSTYRTPEGLDLPQNYDRLHRGPVTLRRALACSLNVPAMRELNSLGGPRPLHRFLTKLGLSTLGKDPDRHGLGLTIGNAPVRLTELAAAYATLARGGLWKPVVLFPALPAAPPHSVGVSETSIYQIADILSDPDARASVFPPGGPLDLPFRCAVKTGTSSDFRDNWCVGFTPDFTVAVWAGNFENQPMKGLSGVSGAGPIFQRSMLRLHQRHPPTWFSRPDGLVDVTIDPRNGKRVPPGTPGAVTDLVPASRVPQNAVPADYTADGKARLDATYAAWFESAQNARRSEFDLALTTTFPEPLRILAPADGTTFLLDPEIPSGSDRLRPVTNLPGTARWSSPTLRIEASTPEPVVHLAPGTHTLTATDPRTGQETAVTVHVKGM